MEFLVSSDAVKGIKLMNVAIQRPPEPISLVIPALYFQSE